MDIIKAVIGIIVGVMVIFLVIQFALPAILVVFAFVIIMSVLRSWRSAGNQNRSRREYEQQTNRTQANRQRQNNTYQSTRSNSHPDIIDAEYTEEEIVD